MHETAVVFGERAILLAGGEHAPLPGRVLLPGPGATVADRADRAVDPGAARRRWDAAEALGTRLPDQLHVDIPAAERLCPPSSADLRHAEAALEAGLWRYRIEHCAPGPRLAALLDQRPDDLAPAPGHGPVAAETVDIPAIAGNPARSVAVLTSDPDRAPAPAAQEQWPDIVLSTIQARARLIAHLQAAQYDDIAALSACYPGIHQFLATELALALHLTDTEAAGLVDDAEALRDRLPDTRKALSGGLIDLAKACAMVRVTGTCTAEVARTVERAVLPGSATATATAVRRRAARAVIAADPDGAADRHRRARRERHVWRAPDADGMARLGILAPAQDIATVWEAITAVADTIRRPGDTRTRGARRCDAITMICTDILGAGGWGAVRLPDKGRGRPRITVTVPYTALLGHRAPCHLDGHGPIVTEQALAIAAGGDLYRMVCDPSSGVVLDYGRTRYRPPPHLAEFVRMRDGECPMPSCHQPAARNPIDHVIPARPDPITGLPTLGTTAAGNLAPPCPHHHLAKDADRGYSLHRGRDGTYTWTTPLGRRYQWRPEPRWDRVTDEIPTAGPDAACDCPANCSCQEGMRGDPSDAIPLVRPPGDYDDHMPTPTARTSRPPAPRRVESPPTVHPRTRHCDTRHRDTRHRDTAHDDTGDADTGRLDAGPLGPACLDPRPLGPACLDPGRLDAGRLDPADPTPDPDSPPF